MYLPAYRNAILAKLTFARKSCGPIEEQFSLVQTFLRNDGLRCAGNSTHTINVTKVSNRDDLSWVQNSLATAVEMVLVKDDLEGCGFITLEQRQRQQEVQEGAAPPGPWQSAERHEGVAGVDCLVGCHFK